MTKKPSYRFTGYAEPWEEKKLRETETLFTDGNYGEAYPSEKDLTTSENGVPFLRGSNLVNGVLDETNANYITHEKHEELTSGHIELDDIILAVRGSLGAIGYAKDENVGWNINSQLAIIRTNKNEAKGDFLLQFFISTKGQRELLSRNTGTALKQLPLKQLKDIPVPLPSLPEQTAIGSFFQDIDQLISLQQCKLEVLKEQKKTYLKLLFPAKGQIKPALRFAGFEDEWKEVKLGEVTDRYDNLRVPVSANERVSGATPYYGANGIQDYVDGYTHDGEFILIAEDGASDLKDYPVQYVNGKVWVNNHAHVIQGKNNLINNIFLLFAVKQINIEPFLVGGGRTKLNSDIMMKLPLHLPSLPEQEAIGSFFQDLDKAIAKQEEKVNQLKESKQTLLRKMFI
ncbi:restriction endonuclease subunit S [Streptococcus mitis]|jgi:complete genome|uniref:Restriction endonuclease subunit S n=1 Tax=Streptococcus mitis TaxID=28037 RepID=A0A2I1YZJ4_STRMT|nr:restriction endonuclease subunit S [Streptococcus mitis]PLA60295.1 restriction endonuclease subunit S [Streptococcus mitis]